MKPERILISEAMRQLPPEWSVDLLPDIRTLVEQTGAKLVVLDDDPTGSQTVWDIPLLMHWSCDALQMELESDYPAFFILTNSRSLPTQQAEQVGAEIGRHLAEAGRRSGRKIAVVSRGDSTLRGHFPEEVDSLVAGLGVDFDAWLLIPTLHSAGRYTLGDIHYAAEGDWLVPVGQTSYAQDGTFGYHSSNLREWVAEKTAGRIPADRVASISIEDIRLGGPQVVYQKLVALPHGSVVVVNAASQRDFEVLVTGILFAEQQGKKYIYRATASFIPVRFGLEPYPLLDVQSLGLSENGGGLIIVGSYVPKTTEQVNVLRERGLAANVEVKVDRLLDPEGRFEEVRQAANQVDFAIRNNRNVLLYTSRRLVSGHDQSLNLQIGQQVSSGLVEILHHLHERPRYIIAKGGITSHDIATKGLGVQRALVMGQICQGLSVWRLGPETRYKDLLYIVFPGNIGSPNTLADVVEKLSNPLKGN